MSPAWSPALPRQCPPGSAADQGTVTKLARETMGSPGGELCIGDVYLHWEYTDTETPGRPK